MNKYKRNKINRIDNLFYSLNGESILDKFSTQENKIKLIRKSLGLK